MGPLVHVSIMGEEDEGVKGQKPQRQATTYVVVGDSLG